MSVWHSCLYSDRLQVLSGVPQGFVVGHYFSIITCYPASKILKRGLIGTTFLVVDRSVTVDLSTIMLQVCGANYIHFLYEVMRLE